MGLRRLLPSTAKGTTMGEVGRRGLENSAPTRGETSWLLLQQKQQTRGMPQPTGNGNAPWKSVSNK